MPILDIKELKIEDIKKALKFIDDNKYRENNFTYVDDGGKSTRASTVYDLVYNDKRYPPKFVIAVAKRLPNGKIPGSTSIPNSVACRRFLKKELGFTIEKKSTDNINMVNSENLTKKYSKILLKSKNIIFRGAPGTGKTYLAKQIASEIVSNGKTHDYQKLTNKQKKQIGFIQFHPSYDYSDFVEGLRPKMNKDGSIGFELKEGVFKRFISKAIKNSGTSNQNKIEKEHIIRILSTLQKNQTILKTKHGSEFLIKSFSKDGESIRIEGSNISREEERVININNLLKMLNSDHRLLTVKDVAKFLKESQLQVHSYYFSIYNKINSETSPKYVFIIDEINRGEISKIFGELFFTIDPAYRGEKGAVSTQYSNLHSNSEERFYIPENVYIIGTMNDIDRSVDSFDFAMRRRFRFIEIKAEERISMLDELGDEKNEAIERMKNLNQVISETEGLNENYHIGPAYFLKLDTLNFDELWDDHLEPLLQDYIRGMYDEKAIMKKFKDAYDGKRSSLNDKTEDR